MDANSNLYLSELGRDHDNGPPTSFVYIQSDNKFLKNFDLKVYYPYFLKNALQKNEIKPIIQNYLSVLLKLNSSVLLRTFFLENKLYSVGINLDRKEVYLFSQRLSDELLLLSTLEEGSNSYQNLSGFIEKINAISLEKTPTEVSYLRATYDLQAYDDVKLLKDFDYKNVRIDSLKIRSQLIMMMKSYRSSFFEKISDFFLNLTSEYDLVRIHFLKFLAVLPCLDHDKTGREVKRIFLETLKRFLFDNKKAKKKLLKKSIKSMPSRYSITIWWTYQVGKFIPSYPLSFVLRFSTRVIAKRFIAGETIKESVGQLKALDKTKRSATIDQLGELVLTELEANTYKEKVIEIIYGLKDIYEPGTRNKAGILKAHISLKVSALASDFRIGAFRYNYEQIAPRLIEILKIAKKEQVFINIDAEHYHFRDMIWEIYREVLESDKELYEWQETGIVIQAYLKDAFTHFREVASFCAKRKIVMPIRLVKGAYWDAETVEARAHSDSPPQFINKVETDIHFRQLVRETFKERFLQLCLASHNIDDHAFAHSLREVSFPHAHPIEHQCLHMTYEALSFSLAQMGFAVRNYIPVGDLLVGMAYLVRRIMENSSQVGVLSIMRSHLLPTKSKDLSEVLQEAIHNKTYQFEENIEKKEQNFFSNPPLKTYLTKYRVPFENCYKDFKKSILKNSDEKNAVLSPNDRSIIVGNITRFKGEDAKGFVDNALEGFNRLSWKSDFSYRARCLVHAVSLMREKRDELSALVMYEAGKSVSEAQADVDEAIDFITFYLREEKKLQAEHNLYPKGVILIIAPWNFPLAIACGMSVAALVAGNSVIVKSAEYTPLVVDELTKIFHEAGVPELCYQHAPGKGSDLGQKLTEDPRIAGVVFTGSKEVGSYLYRQNMGKLYKHPEWDQTLQKRVITEMGGKNAVIVTNNCELDETVSGILYAAFAHAGQKCSAASRVIVHKSIKEAFLKRFIDACKAIKTGPADDWSTLINPIVSKKEKERVLNTREEILKEVEDFGGEIHVDRVLDEREEGNFVGPLVVELPVERSLNPESSALQEHFAPVVHIIEFSGLNQAIDILNASEYALTAGIFSQSQYEIDFLSKKINAGNIYINRPNTGARVGIEPFGGFYYSGTGPKAGGVMYLRKFHVQIGPKVNLLSHIDTGSDYVKLGVFSRLTYEDRYKKLIKQKDLKIDWYLLEQFFNRLENEETRANKNIPGQISFDFFDNHKKNALLVTSFLEPNRDFIQWLSMLYLNGSAVTVCACNQKSYEFLSLRFGKFKSVEVLNISTQMLNKIYEEEFNFIYLEGDEIFVAGEVEKVQKTISEGPVSILSNFTHELTGLDDYTLALTHTKSMAVNTMRHGAPLSLVD